MPCQKWRARYKYNRENGDAYNKQDKAESYVSHWLILIFKINNALITRPMAASIKKCIRMKIIFGRRPMALAALYIRPKIAGLTPGFSVAFRTSCRILPKNVATQEYCVSLIEKCLIEQDYCVGAQENDPPTIHDLKF
jgi:hypothetical protein